MDRSYPLSGTYSDDQFVYVKGKEAEEDLNHLGYYGTSIENALRKEPERRGPLDRNLVAHSADSETTSLTLLTLVEAYFLAFSLGCLSISGPRSDKTLSISDLWSKFRRYHTESQMSLDFAQEFAVYHYFRSRGWTVRAGDNFGVNFLLYRECPSVDHAQYAVKILTEPTEVFGESLHWDSALTYHRVVQSANKELLLVFISEVDSEQQNYSSPDCIRSMKLTCRLFSGNVPVSNTKCDTTDPWLKLRPLSIVKQ